MTTGKALNGNPYAGNPHVRFDEGEVASAAMPRRGSLLYNSRREFIQNTLLASVACGTAAEAVAKKPDFKPVDAKRLGKAILHDQAFQEPTVQL